MVDANTNKSIDDIKEPYDTEEETSFDAKVMEEEIEVGEREAPAVNVESDYEAAQEFSQSDDSDETAVNSL